MAGQHILQVSELTKKVRFMLESELNTVWLCGEISNFIAAGSGHWYLTLKDQKSQVKCAMFKGSNHRVRMTPQNGQQVLVRAKVSLYEPRGDFQLIIELMEDAGEGMLRQQYEQLKQQLNAQGMFAAEHKKALPTKINTIGIVTSPTGAAVKDILSVLKRRNPTLSVIIYPSLVQGEQAKYELVDAINIANQRNECDLLIVGRGGGSLEDLWPFNEELVVKAIFNSTLPIISAVGHEIDTTLSDYVADFRAVTPSAAAEFVAKDINDMHEKIANLRDKISTCAAQMLSNTRMHCQQLTHRLNQTHPEQQLRLYQQRADELTLRLNNTLNSKVQLASAPVKQLHARLLHLNPRTAILNYQQHNQQLKHRASTAMNKLVQYKQAHFVNMIEQLHIVSPLATIARGYSVTRNQSGDIISRAKDVSLGEKITIQISDAVIDAKVSAVKPEVKSKHSAND